MRRNAYDRPENEMIGPGGEIVYPASESVQIERALKYLDDGNIKGAIRTLWRLREQVSRGFHRNPSTSRLYEPFKVVGTIAKDVYDIRYRHSKNGKDYEHEFNGKVNILAIERHGKREMLIASERGLPLWDEFPDE